MGCVAVNIIQLVQYSAYWRALLYVANKFRIQ
jgi:hypothetical protein